MDAHSQLNFLVGSPSITIITIITAVLGTHILILLIIFLVDVSPKKSQY